MCTVPCLGVVYSFHLAFLPFSSLKINPPSLFPLATGYNPWLLGVVARCVAEIQTPLSLYGGDVGGHGVLDDGEKMRWRRNGASNDTRQAGE